MYKRILVPVDGSDTAARGLREAIGLAAEQKATLRLLHVIDDYPMLVELASVAAYEETMEHLRAYGRKQLASAQGSAQEAGLQVETQLRETTGQRVGDVIVEEARQSGCDLIVMGTHGRRGFSRMMMGSDAELVLRASPVPILLVRSAEPG